MVLVITTSVFLLNGCNSGGDPKATLSAFFDAMSKKDIAAARKLATEDSKGMFDLMEEGMKMSKDNTDTEKYDQTKMQIGEPIINGDKATIAVKEKSSAETVNFTLKKESGTWKVAFDKASLMEMGTDKMKEKGVSIDSLKDAMKELKNINIDSLKQGIDKGIQALDSAKQLLESIKK
jgi:pullulanase/glycogen debranching enzyme